MDLCLTPCTMKQFLTEINKPEKTGGKKVSKEKGKKEKVLRLDKYKNN